jgi:hypothetical protein
MLPPRIEHGTFALQERRSATELQEPSTDIAPLYFIYVFVFSELTQAPICSMRRQAYSGSMWLSLRGLKVA